MNWLKRAQEEYRGYHRPPGKGGGRADDLTMNGAYPEDVYTRPDFYERGKGLAEMMKIIQLRNKPEAPVWIFRAVPKEVAGLFKGRSSDLINSGDWVTTNREYAKGHGESALGRKYIIVSKRVKARELYTEGNSIFEWGYSP